MKVSQLFSHRAKACAAAVAVLAGAVVFTSCNKDDDDDDPVPSITSISPSSASPGDTVSIAGKNFSTSTSKETVTFGTATATLLSSAAASIQAVVPELDAGTYDVSVTVSKQTSGTYSFTVTEAADGDTTTTEEAHIELESFSPTTIKYNEELTITGKNFTGEVEVYVNGKQQTTDLAVSDDSTTITVKMDAKTFSGAVRVVQGDDDETFADELNYELTYGTPTDFSEEGDIFAMAFMEDGSLYAADNNLYRLDANGNKVETIVDNSVLYVNDFCRASDGTIFFCDDRNPGILTIDENGTIDTVVLDDDNFPELRLGGLSCNDNKDTIYVATYDGNDVAMVDLTSGSPVVSLFNQDYSKATYSVVLRNDTLFVLTKIGITKFPKTGGTAEEVISIDDNDFIKADFTLYQETQDIFIAGGTSKCLYRLSSDNQLEQVFSASDLGFGSANYACSVAIDYDGDLFVTSNEKIVKIEVF